MDFAFENSYDPIYSYFGSVDREMDRQIVSYVIKEELKNRIKTDITFYGLKLLYVLSVFLVEFKIM